MGRHKRSLALRTELFWARVDRSAGPDNCWPWQGSRVSSGHGTSSEGPAHRSRPVASQYPTMQVPSAMQ